MPAIASGASPLLMMVTTVAALVVPKRWLANGTLAGDSVAVGGAWPVPVRFTDCTLPATPFELSVNFRTAGPLAPAAPGVNVSATVHVLLPAVELTVPLATQVVPAPATIAKSDAFVLAGSITTLAIVRLAVPVLVNVTVCWALLMLTNWLPKLNAAGTEATGAMPVPFSVTVCVVGLALSVTVKVAVRAPVPLGVKVRPTVHEPPLAPTVALLRQVVPVGTIAKSLALVPPMVTALAAANCTARPPELVSVTVT